MIRHRRPVETCGGEYLDVPLFRGSSGRIEIRRHHADDLIQVGVHPHVLTEDVWIATERSFPESITDNDFAIEAWGIIFGVEAPPEPRLHAQQREVIRRDDQQ